MDLVSRRGGLSLSARLTHDGGHFLPCSYEAQGSATAELRQLRTALGAAEENLTSTRVALESQTSRARELEAKLREAREENGGLRGARAAQREAEAELAALRESSGASLAQVCISATSPRHLPGISHGSTWHPSPSQYKEDNAVLVGEVRRLQAECNDSASTSRAQAEESRTLARWDGGHFLQAAGTAPFTYDLGEFYIGRRPLFAGGGHCAVP